MISLRKLWDYLLKITQNDESDIPTEVFLIVFDMSVDEINNFHDSSFAHGKGVGYSYNGMNEKFSYILKLALLKNYFIFNDEDISTLKNNNEKLILGLTKLDYPSDFPIQFRIVKRRLINAILDQKELFYDDTKEVFDALSPEEKNEFVKEKLWIDADNEKDDALLQDINLVNFDLVLTYENNNVLVVIKPKKDDVKYEFKKSVRINFLKEV